MNSPLHAVVYFLAGLSPLLAFGWISTVRHYRWEREYSQAKIKGLNQMRLDLEDKLVHAHAQIMAGRKA